MQWENDLNKIPLLSCVGPPAVLSEGGDDRGQEEDIDATLCRVCLGSG